MKKQVVVHPVNLKGVEAPIQVKVEFMKGEELAQTVNFGYSGKGGRRPYLLKNGEVRPMKTVEFINTVEKWGAVNILDLKRAISRIRPIFTRNLVVGKCSVCGEDVNAANRDYIQRNHEKLGVSENAMLCQKCQHDGDKEPTPKQETQEEKGAPSESEASSSALQPVRFELSVEQAQKLVDLELPNNLRKDIRKVIESLQAYCEKKGYAKTEEVIEEEVKEPAETFESVSEEEDVCVICHSKHYSEWDEYAECPECLIKHANLFEPEAVTEAEMFLEKIANAESVGEEVDATQYEETQEEIANELEAHSKANVSELPEENIGICRVCLRMNVALSDKNTCKDC